MGQPVQPVVTDEEKKIGSMKTRSKILNIIAAITVAAVSVPTVYFGPDTEGCSGYLIRTIFVWAFIFGVLLLAAELELSIVQEHVHVLTYRSGRAFLMTFLGSIALAATPGEIPIAYAAPGVTTKTRVLVSINWRLCVPVATNACAG